MIDTVRNLLPEISDKMATDRYAMAFDFYQEIHRMRTFFRKLQQADSLDTD